MSAAEPSTAIAFPSPNPVVGGDGGQQRGIGEAIRYHAAADRGVESPLAIGPGTRSSTDGATGIARTRST